MDAHLFYCDLTYLNHIRYVKNAHLWIYFCFLNRNRILSVTLKLSVSGLSEIKLNFPTAVLVGLLFARLAGKALVIQQCFGTISTTFPIVPLWQWRRSWDGKDLPQLTQTDQRDILYYMVSTQQSKLIIRRKVERRLFPSYFLPSLSYWGQ